jgi:gamma-glutamylcyclotransferase (GGCT)/AIG2-like uncharacterized protein YtfP
MPRLFSYGSLRETRVQLATFGRVLAGREDALPGFELCTVQRGERQLANVVRRKDTHGHVPGTVFEISDAELAAADEYERPDAYTRTRVQLTSGIEAWVFVEAASLR